MKVLLISNLREKKGLFKDALVLSKLIEELGHNPISVDFRDEISVEGIDLAIHLEVVRQDLFDELQRNWWIPNPEWASSDKMAVIGKFEQVLCKTQDAFRIFSEYANNTVLTGFTCEDKLDERVPREKIFFHAHRGSIVKGTEVIRQAQTKIAFPIIFAEDFDDATLKNWQNRCLFHLCPSEYEGWGHSLHEALSVGAVVVSSDTPPMSDMKGLARLVKTDPNGSICLANLGKPRVDSLVEAIEWCQKLTDSEIAELSLKARQTYEEKTEDFKRVFSELISKPVTIRPKMPKGESVAVIIATYGDKEYWDSLAERAMQSVREQTLPPTEIIRVHGNTLAGARNQGVESCHSRWCILLDADDILDPFYISSILAGSGDIRYPKVEVYNENGLVKRDIPRYDHLINGNFIVIGALFKREDFLRVGGFDDELPVLEDWDLWIRLWLNGAKIEPSHAIYKVYGNPNSRNRQSTGEVNWVEIIRNRYAGIAKKRHLI